MSDSDLDRLREALTPQKPLVSWHEASFTAGVDAVLDLLVPVGWLCPRHGAHAGGSYCDEPRMATYRIRDPKENQ